MVPTKLGRLGPELVRVAKRSLRRLLEGALASTGLADRLRGGKPCLAKRGGFGSPALAMTPRTHGISVYSPFLSRPGDPPASPPILLLRLSFRMVQGYHIAHS